MRHANLSEEALEEAVAKCKCLALMIKFYQNCKQVKGKLYIERVNDLPSVIAQDLAERFCTPSGDGRYVFFLRISSLLRFFVTARNLKKLVHFILILALFCTKFRLHANKASKDLLMSTAEYVKVKTYY